MKSVSLTAFPRSVAKRSGVKKLRSEGRVPAVIYGRQRKPQNLEINVEDLKKLIKHSVSENLLVDLAVQGDASAKRLALVQEVQHHALSGMLLHVDFHEVAADEKVTLMIAVETTGEAVGVKSGGGVLEHVLFKIKVRALPKDLPEVILVDVTHLEIGKSIHLGEIKLPEGVEVLGNKEIVVLSVAAPLTEAQEVAAETAGTGEVEMIKEKKEDGTDAKAADKGADKAGDKGGEKAGDKGEKKPAEKKK